MWAVSVTMENYYKLLQIDPSAEPEVITAAYRRLAMKYHPDTSGDGAEAKARMQAINEAYAVLSDPVQRAAYDRRLAAQAASSQSRSNGWGAPHTSHAAPPRSEAHEPETESRPINARFNARSVVVFLTIAAALLAIVLLGFRTVSPVELVIVLGVSLLLVQPVSAWLANRTRR